ncbi:MAG TPA: zinc metallopeptidase [Chloroflexota bacterium]|nr:zinc metallopeptidase [Chloroflexota bacterium]
MSPSTSNSSFWIDLLLIVPVLLAWWSQARVRHAFREADQIQNEEHISGYETARYLLDESGLGTIPVVVGQGTLSGDSDAYDPVAKRVVISKQTASHSTDLSVGVAGHEVGHATQDAEGFPLMRLRTSIANWLIRVSWVSSFAFVGGFLLGIVPLMWVTVGIMGVQVLFALVTLPVEINASGRAIKLLERGRLIALSEKRSVQKVLRAAAFTYLASAAQTLAFFLFCVIVLAAAVGLQLPR